MLDVDNVLATGTWQSSLFGRDVVCLKERDAVDPAPWRKCGSRNILDCYLRITNFQETCEGWRAIMAWYLLLVELEL